MNHVDNVSVSPIQQQTRSANLDVDITKIESSVLSRLVEEVKNNEPSTVRAFDRVHNRHNR
jgi:hypothetical protein